MNSSENIIRVFIADDHPLFLRGIKYSLKNENNIEIIGEASNGKEALELVKELIPDITILDYNMPEYTGLEILKIIRKKKISTEVIFLTMHHEPEVFKEAIHLKAKGYLLKDGAEEEIINAVVAVSRGETYISPVLSGHLINELESVKNKNNLPGELESLSRTEITVLKLVASNKTTQEIADELFISERTVDRHRSNICKKLNITGNNALLKYALENKRLF